ncbi:MAG: HD domain-containing protein, partial [Acidimicrobiales bacterium]
MTRTEGASRARAVATVERVLPWRRQVQTADALRPLLSAFRSRHTRDETGLIVRAYEAAATAHQGQLRNSGEAYISHPLAVATILAGLGLDDVTIAAALLHDAVEDTAFGLREIEDDFGSVVAGIVDGVTKLDRVRFDSKQAHQAATMRKMLVAIAKDPRVLLIKLADRLHNL